MRWSAKQFRWLALGGALLLAGVLAALLGLSKYRAGKIWQQILRRNGVNLVQESNGITWSQSVKGRTVFTLHAEKSTPHGNGVYSLHNGVLILYGKDGRDDRIHGNEFEYDQNQGILKAIGEVRMDLQAPEPAGSGKMHAPLKSFSFLPDDEAAADPSVIHVRTSGLVFLRKLEVAATTEPVEFSYRGMRCDSVGAEFESGQGVLHLLAQVKLEGTLRDAPFTLTAARADLDRTANTVALASADWASGERAARADRALLYLRKDGSLEKGDGAGNVMLRADTRTLSAPQAHAEFGAENKPERAVFTGGVQFTDHAPNMMERGASASLTLTADAQGVLNNAVADGNVQLHTEQTTQAEPRAPARSAAGRDVTGTRDLKAQRATASFGAVPAGKQPLLTKLHLQGGAQLVTVSAGGAGTGTGETRTAVRADDLTTGFVPDARHQPEPKTMTGLGRTVLEQSAADGARQVSEGERLEAQFAPRAGGRATGQQGTGAGAETVEVSTAVQTGHVVLHAWPAAKGSAGQGTAAAAEPSVGRAERAVYEAANGTLTLTAGADGRAEVNDGSTQLSAPEIVLHQASGDGEASGGVALTSVGQPGTPATHVLAARAKLLHAIDVAQFYGSDREPAQMWQGSSQVSAANLLLDGRRHTLMARPAAAGALVHGVFATQRAGASGKMLPASGGAQGVGSGTAASSATSGSTAGSLFGKAGSAQVLANQRQTEASGDAVRVAAEALDYSDPDHEATFQGHVTVRGAEGVLSGDRGVVFLQNPGPGNQKAGTKPAPAAGMAGLGAAGMAGLGAAGGMAGLGAAGGMGGRLERFVLLGDVRLLQPGRSGQGQQLTYTAATDRFVLTGAPGVLPRVTDAQQGVVTGETLVFGSADKSVVVVGEPGTGHADHPAAGRRVHTETEIKR